MTSRTVGMQHNHDTENHDALGYYPQKAMHVLTVGDGDFSFSLAVSRLVLGVGSQETQTTHITKATSNDPCSDTKSRSSSVVATSYESYQRLLAVYPKIIESTTTQLRQLGVEILYSIDATNLDKVPQLSNRRFDRIVWNFPCTAVGHGQDGQNSAMQDNKALVRAFVRNARQYLRPNGEIHMCHKTKPPYNQWDMEKVVLMGSKNNNNNNNDDDDDDNDEKSEYVLDGRVVLDRATLSPYTPRKALDRKSFPCHDACTYVFRYIGNSSDGNNVKEKMGIGGDTERSVPSTLESPNIVPVTEERILSIRSKLVRIAKKKQNRKPKRQKYKR